MRATICIPIAFVLGACAGTTQRDAPIARSDASAPSLDAARGTPPGPHEGELPCDVAEALAAGCGDCHARTPRFGAPMPLASRGDLLAPSTRDAATPTWRAVRARVADGTMPPPGRAFSDAQRDTLLAWIDASLPAREASETCDELPPSDPQAGPEHLPCTPTHTFVAHGASAGTPYEVSADADGNTYTCFAFRSPFAAGELATAWAPVIDNERILHHWILWGSDQTPPGGGGAFPCDALPASDAAFLMGWAPGGDNSVMPDDVGVELSHSWLVLQAHYYVGGDASTDRRDASGVAVCTTTEARPHIAGVLGFGTVEIDIPPRADDHVEQMTCPGFVMGLLGSDLTVLSSGPHMHTRGTAFRSEIVRADGSVETLADVTRWSFDDQSGIPYSPARVIRRGDTVRVSCTYDNPTSERIRFGENTEDEMCFDFMLVWPIDRWPRGIPRFCAELSGLSL